MKTYFKLTLSMFLCLALAVSVDAQQEQFGQASYYSDAYHGKKTASGKRYDKTKMTAAHNDFPFGSVIKVTHLSSKKSVTVTVTDRGPYIKGRIVDLSKAAAQKIGLITDGVAQVKIELVKDSKGKDQLTAKGNKKPDEYSTAATRKNLETKIKKSNASGAGGKTPPAKTKASKVAKAAIAKAKPAPAPTTVTPKGDAAQAGLPLFTSKDMSDSDLYQISLMKPKKEGFGVQVASFSDYENVLKKVAELQGKFFQNILIRTETAGGENIYKIILGQYETRDQANSYKKDLKKKKKVNGFVIALGDEE